VTQPSPLPLLAELENVGQKGAALDTLENVIKSKRHRAWTPTLEQILKKFLGDFPTCSCTPFAGGVVVVDHPGGYRRSAVARTCMSSRT
jgi:hypothetical protein